MLDYSDLKALKQGWKAGFGDDDEFIDCFFSRYDNDTTRVVHRNEKGEIVAQMHTFFFNDDKCKSKGCYIYGVTTLPEYRGGGIARTMILNHLAALQRNGVAYAVLIAEDEELQEWYKKMGFEKRSQIIEVRGKNDDMNFAMDNAELNCGMYYRLNPEITDFTSKILIEP